MSFERTYEWLDILEKKFPNKIRIDSIGRTNQGRSIRSVTINKSATPIVIVVANMHAREWAAMSSAIYIIHEMVYHPYKYPVASHYQWIIVPIANPDGYEYTRTTERLWRKNLNSPLGIDINRNFGFMWEAANDDDKSPERETYRGYAPFSEKESQAISKLLQQKAAFTILYVDLHAYGQNILFPWSFTADPAPNAAWSRTVAEEGARGILARTGKTYKAGTPAELSFLESGSSIDYCYSLQIKACMAIELTAGGYEIQNNSIPAVGQEALAAVETMAIYETNLWLEALVAKYAPKCKLQSIGKSYEGRDINAIFINTQHNKKVFIVANMHAREWAAMTSAIFIIHELLRNPNSYREASNYQWIVVPIANPDGYEYTKTVDRIWRKNRTPQANNAIGVDLNRNFNYMWDHLMRPEDDNPREETFRGPWPFSEPESQAIGNFLQQNANSLMMYVDLHTYGEYILIPWGYTTDPAPNVDWLRSVAHAGSSAAYFQTNQFFEVGTPAELVYTVSGSSMDYCYSLGVKACITNRTKASDFNVFDFFLSYEETQEWLEALAFEYPEKCRIQSLGETYEGRNVIAITINYNKPKKVIVIGNLQAREWVGMTSAIFIIHELILSAGNNQDALQYQWIVVPIPNPDGYEYTREHDRNWNKNRSPQKQKNFGVNLDSNFNNNWNVNGVPSRADPAGRPYRGPSPFSEPETKGIRDLMQNNLDAILSVDLQGYGQVFLVPWSWTSEPAPNAERTQAIAYAGRAAIYELSQEKFEVGIASNFLPFAFGVCHDYCTAIGLKACISLKLTLQQHDIRTDQIIRFETNEFMHKLASLFSSKVSVEKIGETWLGRDINVFNINYSAKKTIILVANLHAREWAAMTSALYIMYELVYNSEHYPDLAQFRWMIIPMANPDGYEYTRMYDRYWSKNRSPQPHSRSFGVDLNGNFGYKWEENDKPVDPNSRTYNGPSAFSEKESSAIGSLIDQYAHETILYVDMHTFGNHIFYPWAYSNDPAPDAGKSRSVALSAADVIREKFQEYYTVGTPAHIFQRTYGTSLDYCHSRGVNVCLWFEMTYVGFQIEEDKIVRYASTFPAKVRVEKIGESALGRDINLININYFAKNTVILVANLHAREWAAMTTALFIISELVYNGNSYPELAQLRWMIIPVANPDGYEYTRMYDRYWSKNRSPQPNSDAIGVDLNGNFAYKWEENNKPVDPSDRTYNGPSAGSEPETQAISQLLERNGHEIILFVDMHTFGNHIFHPWSYTREPVEHIERTKAVAHAGADAIRFKYQEYYTVGTPSELYRRTYGTSIDYCEALGTHICLWLEMTNSGFTFEENKIIRYGEEGWTGIKAMALKAIELR
uniref:Peptidase M14 domain-containing protein n=1 Tax=Anopheles epiroticus TaxID=199890 RepID=A0A182P4X8_9DIPT